MDKNPPARHASGHQLVGSGSRPRFHTGPQTMRPEPCVPPSPRHRFAKPRKLKPGWLIPTLLCLTESCPVRAAASWLQPRQLSREEREGLVQRGAVNPQRASPSPAPGTAPPHLRPPCGLPARGSQGSEASRERGPACWTLLRPEDTSHQRTYVSTGAAVAGRGWVSLPAAPRLVSSRGGCATVSRPGPARPPLPARSAELAEWPNMERPC